MATITVTDVQLYSLKKTHGNIFKNIENRWEVIVGILTLNLGKIKIVEATRVKELFKTKVEYEVEQ